MIHNHCLTITNHDSQPLAQLKTPWFTATGSSQWLRIMVSYAEPVVANQIVLCWASGCESLCALLRKWLWIMVCYTETVVVNHDISPWLTTTCSALHTMINNHLIGITHHDSQRVMISYIVPGLWIVVCNADPVVVNQGVVCWTSACDSWCVMLWIMVSYNEPVGANHGVLLGGSACESWCALLSQWLCIMVWTHHYS
jgi:hypothetical protein